MRKFLYETLRRPVVRDEKPNTKGRIVDLQEVVAKDTNARETADKAVLEVKQSLGLVDENGAEIEGGGADGVDTSRLAILTAVETSNPDLMTKEMQQDLIWEKYKQLCDSSIAKNAETFQAALTWYQNSSFCELKCTEERDALIAFIATRKEKQEALTALLFTEPTEAAPFDGEALQTAINEAVEAVLEVVPSGLILCDRARARLELDGLAKSVEEAAGVLEEAKGKESM